MEQNLIKKKKLKRKKWGGGGVGEWGGGGGMGVGGGREANSREGRRVRGDRVVTGVKSKCLK